MPAGDSVSRRPPAPSWQVNSPVLDGRRGGLRAILHAQLAEDAFHMILYRVHRNAERVGDLLVGPGRAQSAPADGCFQFSLNSKGDGCNRL